ncbi:MAG: hypothetical protein ACXU8S_11230 [Phenylobacterium sp.]
MRADETSRAGTHPAVPMGGLLALAVLALGADAVHAALADSPYWMEHGHRPWVLALRAAALAVEWSQGVKVMVIAGSSLLVLRTQAPRPTCAFRMPNLGRSTPGSLPFGLEAVR